MLVLIPMLTGCRYDGSFMQMDSNTGFPFFGLQLAVDSGSRPPGPTDARPSGESPTFNLNVDDIEETLLESHSGDGKLLELSRNVCVRN